MSQEEEGFSISKLIFIGGLRSFFFFVAIALTIIAYRYAIDFYESIPEEIVQAYGLNGKKLLAYPIVQLIIYTPNYLATIALIWMSIPPFLMLIAANVTSLAGFANSLVYGQQLIRKRQHERDSQHSLTLECEPIAGSHAKSRNKSSEYQKHDSLERALYIY